MRIHEMISGIILLMLGILFLAVIDGEYLTASAQGKPISLTFLTKIIYYDQDGGIIKYETYKQTINGTDKKDFFENYRKNIKMYEPENVTGAIQTKPGELGAVFVDTKNNSATLVPPQNLTMDTYIEFINSTMFRGGATPLSSEASWEISERCFFTGIGWSCQKGLPVHYLGTD
jgi:hypothetical protein